MTSGIRTIPIAVLDLGAATALHPTLLGVKTCVERLQAAS